MAKREDAAVSGTFSLFIASSSLVGSSGPPTEVIALPNSWSTGTAIRSPFFKIRLLLWRWYCRDEKSVDWKEGLVVVGSAILDSTTSFATGGDLNVLDRGGCIDLRSCRGVVGKAPSFMYRAFDKLAS